MSSAITGPPVPAGFVGLANEYSDIEKDVGTDPTQPDVPYEQVLRNLAPYGGLVLRIGGDTTDWTWWPVPGMKQPGWVRYTLTSTWAAVVKRLAQDLNAHLILGVNMEADSSAIAKTEVKELDAALGGSGSVTYEIGNEPELYSKYPFYRFPTYHLRGGGPIRGRPEDYSYSDITSDWTKLASALPTSVSLAGPGYSSVNAQPYLPQFLENARRISLLTVHNYPLKSPRCGGQKLQESQLFAPDALQQEAGLLAPWTALARKFRVPVRVDELNAVTCGGVVGFSNSFGPALWALNILPMYLAAGVQGVNIESRPFTAQNLAQAAETASGWQVQVQPEYYGMLAFAQLTPPGSHLLRVSSTETGLLAYAVATPSRESAVVLTNVTGRRMTVSLEVAGASGAASVKTLAATRGGLSATGGVSLGGQTISPTTGALTGAPVAASVPPSGGQYRIQVPAASAAIVSLATHK